MPKDKQDKAELARIKEDLEDLQLYLEEFSAFLPLPIVSVNPLGFILDINKTLEGFVGLKQIEIIGEPVENFFSGKKKFRVLQQRVLKGEYTKGAELFLLSKNKKVPINIYLAPRKDRENNIIGYFITFFDISEFKKLQESLEEKVRERTKELQKRLNELERFHSLIVGRELKMAELKKELKVLKDTNK